MVAPVDEGMLSYSASTDGPALYPEAARLAMEAALHQSEFTFLWEVSREVASAAKDIRQIFVVIAGCGPGAVRGSHPYYAIVRKSPCPVLCSRIVRQRIRCSGRGDRSFSTMKSDLIYGANNRIVTTFAVVAGVAGPRLPGLS